MTKRITFPLLAGVLFGLAATDAGAQQAPDVGRLLLEMRQRESQLDRRARELDERERTIVELETRVDERLAELRQMQETIEQRIRDWEAQDGDRIKRLAKVYEAMPPGSAAPLLENLELDLATSIVSSMKAKKSAAVLAAMDPEEALSMSRRVARPLEPKPAEEGNE